MDKKKINLLRLSVKCLMYYRNDLYLDAGIKELAATFLGHITIFEKVKNQTT